jgi:hypothetical protein
MPLKPQAVRDEMRKHVKVLPGGGLRTSFEWRLTPGDLVVVAGTPVAPHDEGGMTYVGEHEHLRRLEVEKVRNRARRRGFPLAQAAADPRYGILP